MDAKEMRTHAAMCRALAVTAFEPERSRYRRMAVGWEEQAENQDWLDGVSLQRSAVQPELDRAA
jgi:hypothetical protein